MIQEYNDIIARLKARAQLTTRNPLLEDSRIFGLIWRNGNDTIGRNDMIDNEIHGGGSQPTLTG